MSKMKEIPIEVLRRVLSYDPLAGRLTFLPVTPDLFTDGKHGASRRCAMWNGKCAGKEALKNMVKGYPSGRVFGVSLYAHRAAWAIYYGEWPDELDHVNRDRLDYRIANLRKATRSQNASNKPKQQSASSRFIGVSHRASSGRFIARIKVLQKNKHIGCFLSEEDAARAYDAAAREHFGEFANLNFPDERANQ